ncbi:hypothetical protein FHU37_005401 [Allostreptomyces psammosilenae]|uniref:Uncharacterized protein n=1 Tax=Allostreptomyces psammosilenae TaxID=1892865 RepID=A0A853ADG5_9ACTN|nr:hypothetical protein [Allostreptomyces psammosilenae]
MGGDAMTRHREGWGRVLRASGAGRDGGRA